MPFLYKILGQSNPSAITNTTLYTVPSGSSAIVSTITVCATTGTDSYRIAAIPSGESLATKHYIVYDGSVDFQDSVVLTLGISLGSQDSIVVYANGSGLVFNAFGTEVS